MDAANSKVVPNTFQTPNIYVDRLMPLLTDSELRILIYAVRRIIGWHKQVDHISLSQFCEGALNKDGTTRDYGAGIGRGAAIEALSSLVKFGILLKVSENDPYKNEGAVYEINLDDSRIDFDGMIERYNHWIETNRVRTSAGRQKITNARSVTQTTPQSVQQTTPSLSDEPSPVGETDHPQSVQQTAPSLSDRHTKDILNPDLKPDLNQEPPPSAEESPTTQPETNVEPDQRVQDAWQYTLGELRMSMGKADFDTWVNPLKPRNCIAAVFRVETCNEFGLKWCESRLKNTTGRLLSAYFGYPVTVVFELAGPVEELTAADRLGRRQPEKVGYYPNRGTNQQRRRFGEIP